MTEKVEYVRVPLGSDEAIRRAQQRGDELKQMLLRFGKVMSGAELARDLGVTEHFVRDEVRAGRMFTIDINGESLYPAFFANRKYWSQDMYELLAILRVERGWNQWLFFTTARYCLGIRTPLEMLRAGHAQKRLVETAWDFVNDVDNSRFQKMIPSMQAPEVQKAWEVVFGPGPVLRPLKSSHHES